jgi:asparagine synthase (glutamine-hydrolysing)
MQGLVGWLTPKGGDGVQALDAMLKACGRAESPPPAAATGTHWGLAAWARTGEIAEDGEIAVVVTGRPLFDGDAFSEEGTARAILALWRQHGPAMLERIHGSFAIAVLDHREQAAFLAIDRMGVQAMSFCARPDGLIFGNRADAVAGHPDVGRRLDPQGLFNYFYFHMAPAPGTVFAGVEKLQPGECLHWRQGQAKREFYWRLHFRDEPRRDFPEQAQLFHRVLRDSVRRAQGRDEVACFLSGGTDSSAVCGALAQVSGRSPRTYSIGYAVAEFDEMEYARAATQRFGLDAREYTLAPDDLLAAIPVIARHYDEPFGNDSAVPVYHCARLAAEDGYRVMLAGDGGDELFGGNARYAKQKIFEVYHAIPDLLRRGLLEPLAHLPGMVALSPARKLQSYIRQANMPLPERMESYNFVYRQALEEMFAPELLAAADPRQPDAWLRAVYERADSKHFVNRLLHLDFEFTLADSDLRKVNGMTEAVGIEVRYPLLDDEMVAFSGEIPPDWKVKGQQLRWFYKAALRGFLPDKILDKSKHGFGVPFGTWARDYPPLRERVGDALANFKRRGLLQPAYVDRLRRELVETHATYFGKMVWVILMMEEWLSARGL